MKNAVQSELNVRANVVAMDDLRNASQRASTLAMRLLFRTLARPNSMEICVASSDRALVALP